MRIAFLLQAANMAVFGLLDQAATLALGVAVAGCATARRFPCFPRQRLIITASKTLARITAWCSWHGAWAVFWDPRSPAALRRNRKLSGRPIGWLSPCSCWQREFRFRLKKAVRQKINEGTLFSKPGEKLRLLINLCIHTERLSQPPDDGVAVGIRARWR